MAGYCYVELPESVLNSMGYWPVYCSPDDLKEQIKKEALDWRKTIDIFS
jgi:hypothetical protein